MSIRQQIYKQTQWLPDYLAKEVLDFIGYIVAKHRIEVHRENGLTEAQQSVMNHIWDDLEDEVWNDA